MKKVYQTIVDAGRGNCMQAAVASLLELPLEEVPHFIDVAKEKNSNGNFEMFMFLKERGKGYSFLDVHYNNPEGLKQVDHSLEFIKECMRVDGGIDGYFYASVRSKNFEYPVTHAVIVDSELNVVHDVSPSEKCLGMGEHDIISIMTHNENWHIGLDGKIHMNNG